MANAQKEFAKTEAEKKAASSWAKRVRKAKFENPHRHIVFDGPPGPQGPRFVEVEDEQRRSIKVGEWVQRDDGYWVLRIKREHLPAGK